MINTNNNILIDSNICNNRSPKNRVIGLDFFRVALALLIFAFHSHIHFNCSYYWLNDFVEMGAIAMTGFFMLSGYSLHLSSSYKDLNRVQEIKRFYIKRLIAVFPLYLIVALIRVVMDLMVGNSSLVETAVLFPVELFATQSTFSTLFPYSHNNGTWFISCLFICYCAYPFFQQLFLQLSVKAKTVILFVLCGILLYAPFVQHYFQLHYLSVYTSPFYRLIEFLIGIIIAQLNTMTVKNRCLSLVRKPISCFMAIVLLVLSVSMGRRYGLPVDYMLFNIAAVPCFMVIMMSLGSMKFEFIKNPRFLLYLSGIVFAFYLCQILPIWGVSRYLCGLIDVESNVLRILVSFSVCFVGAITLHHVVEKPIAAFLKKKLL